MACFATGWAASEPLPLPQNAFFQPSIAAGSAEASFVECEWLAYHGDLAHYWIDGTGENHTDRFVRFEPAAVCTLKTARVLVYGAGCSGSPTLRVRLYGPWPVYSSTDPSNRLIPDCDSCPPETGTNFLTSIDVAWNDLETSGNWTVVDFTSKPGWPNDYIFGPLNGPFFVTASLSPTTPNPAIDRLALIIDDGYGNGHSGAFLYGQYRYYDVSYGRDYGTFIESYVCYEEPPPTPCEHEDWGTWAHDYQRTGRSHIGIGDPCEVAAVWTANLPGVSNFCEPTIANDRVYVSTDREARVYNLTSGAPISVVTGLPFIFSSNRCNATIEGNGVYLTGGTGQSISKWNLDLTTNQWVNGIGAVGIGPLGAQVRFGVTAVYDIGGTEVVVVGTEGGHLWCLATATGTLYGGWPTNPVVLDAAIYHSPAYDGDDLYVGTTTLALDGGSIYRIDAATGAIVWNETSSYPNEGYPGGVSLDDGFVYAASANANDQGHRVKFSKNGVLKWEWPEARCLYAPPTFGQYVLFIPQDIGGTGILLVDPGTGQAVYNYALDGVGDVPQMVSTTCDGFAFAGDRQGKWWLLDEFGGTTQWSVPLSGIVNGTALGSSTSGNDYALVSVRSGNPVNGGGRLIAFKMNAGNRPRVHQLVSNVDILVPFDASASESHAESAVFGNIGCAGMTVTHTVTDPAPDPIAQTYTSARAQYAASLADAIVGENYTAYFADTKQARMRLASRHLIDPELTMGDKQIADAAAALATSNRATQQMAASSATLRTLSVTYPALLYPGQNADVSWTYDGTGLGRGMDIEEIEFVTNDPDRLLLGGQPVLTIHYSGGCPTSTADLTFNSVPDVNVERVSNSGSLGSNSSNDDLIWAGVEGNLFDGSFILCGDSLTGDESLGEGGAEFHANFYGPPGLHQWQGEFLPNPLPSTLSCGMDGGQDVHLGYIRTGGCPGTPYEVRGEWVRGYYADTNRYVPAGSPLAALNVNVVQTEVGAYDPVYGDFKLIRWEIQNRDSEAKDLYGGSWMDWDVGAIASENSGLYSDLFNGYIIWNATTPDIGFGMCDPNLPTDFSTVEPGVSSPRTIRVEDLRTYDQSPADPAQTYSDGGLWHRCVNNSPLREVMTGSVSTDVGDYAGVLTNKLVTLPANGTVAVHQALFGVDASSDNAATIEANALALAERAAKWAGFARGDVNDDGSVDVLDVCWLSSGQPIYPDTYNGDVDLSGSIDAADQMYLLNYVTGLGPAPLGDWRFAF